MGFPMHVPSEVSYVSFGKTLTRARPELRIANFEGKLAEWN